MNNGYQDFTKLKDNQWRHPNPGDSIMNETKHDESAFPSTQYVSGISPTGHSVGMTLRDYFAAKAMEGLIAQSMGTALGSDPKFAAEYAYAIADEMLKAREK